VVIHESEDATVFKEVVRSSREKYAKKVEKEEKKNTSPAIAPEIKSTKKQRATTRKTRDRDKEPN
jgi:hypothetical protein